MSLSGPRIKVNVSAKVAALTRANVIGHVSREVAAAAGVPAAALKTIFEGFRDGLLRRVKIAQYTRSGELVGYLCIEVDWEKYAINLIQGATSSVFRLDPSAPVTGQMAPLLELAAEFVAAKTSENKVEEVVCHYNALPDKLEELRRRFGTVPLTDVDRKRMSEAALDRELVVSDQNLSEATVTYRYKNLES
ncbi:hypothetical protein ACIBTZ_19455 [Micromonospora sp. NPDC049460]|uniref:hypothetical protein n=1 Tax=unclassified Micromonospora TaxID=2617518 RepID=UPI00371269FF